MYRREELIYHVECTEVELEKIIRKLNIDKKEFTAEDVKRINNEIDRRNELMRNITFLSIAIAIILIILIYIVTAVSANQMLG